MPDSYTDNRNIIQPLVGGDSGTWGGLLNSGAFAQLDLILGNTQAISITAADVTLTTSQWNNCTIKLTGALTGDRSLILPLNVNSATVAVGGVFVVDNQTSGSYNVTVKTIAAGSTGVTVPQGVRTWLYSDATNVYYADDAKVQLIPYAGNPNGFVAGTAAAVNKPPSVVWDYTNAQLYFCTTSGVAASAVWIQQQIAVNRGFNAPINMSLSATHTGGNLLQVAIKTVGGVDPSLTDPVVCYFQTVSGSNTTGAVASVNIITALSMTTSAVGASLGSTSNTPFRIWLALFNNAGTAVLAMRNCSTSSAIYSLAEYGVASTVSVSAAATSAGVWYTPNGTTLSNCAYRIIGYVEYTSGLVTAGTYTTDPNNTVVFGPGIKKPGDIVQTVAPAFGTLTVVTFTALTATNVTASITPSSPINLIKYTANVGASGVNANFPTSLQMYRDSTAIGALLKGGQGATVITGPFTFVGIDAPKTTVSTTYVLKGSCAGSTASVPAVNTDSATEILEEIMG